MPAPIARKAPTERTFHGHTYVDDYEWMRDKQSPELIELLEAENAWADARTAHLGPLREAIVGELASRTREDDTSLPVRQGDWWYFSRTWEGRQYPALFRLPAVGAAVGDGAQADVGAAVGLDAPVAPGVALADSQALGPGAAPAELPSTPSERPSTDREDAQLVYDGNILADGEEFFSTSGFLPAPDGTLGAMGVDFSGDEHFTLRIFEIETGNILDDAVSGLGYGLAWTADSSSVVYSRVNEAWRTWQVWLHRVGTSMEQDVLLFQEDDERFEISFKASRDGRWVVVHSASPTTSEVTLFNAVDIGADPIRVCPRMTGLDYTVEPAGDHLLIVHNANRPDFEVAAAAIHQSWPQSWKPVLIPEPGERISHVEAFRDFAVISMRSGGQTQLRVMRRGEGAANGPTAWQAAVVVPSEDLATIETVGDPHWQAQELVYLTESILTPETCFSYNPATGQTVQLKQLEVPNYDRDEYVQEGVWVEADDGAQIPMTVVRRRDIQADGTNPGLIMGYGAYEISYDPYFAPINISALDRGVVLAFAHPRGGGEMGRAWYEAGRLLNKRNTFTDFVACAKWLHTSGWVAGDRLAAEGRSAGGLLMGAIANIAPERFRAIHAGVPFVDALTTILKPELPLTAGEWEEWGNPIESPEVYEYMRSYSPVENIVECEYPAILATTSLNDVRVFYVEPTKWVQILRERTTNDPIERPILEKIEMVAGHAGKTGRYDRWRERAFELAWVLDQIGAAS
ncbi:MAG: S9 family peptidase [Actinomycetaceae bacterium]|nr:S9 family peptidase [Actinomycetaceae bacterium]